MNNATQTQASEDSMSPVKIVQNINAYDTVSTARIYCHQDSWVVKISGTYPRGKAFHKDLGGYTSYDAAYDMAVYWTTH